MNYRIRICRRKNSKLRTMKHHLTSSEAAVILQTLKKIKQAAKKSPAMMAAIDIDRHDIKKCEAVIKNLKK